MTRPRIGITVDSGKTPRGTRRYESGEAYAQAVYDAGGLPLLLTQHMELIPEYISLCDGFVFTGGDDLDVTAFGQKLDPRATLVDPKRQAFETALYKALDVVPAKPVLGICLGMQLMGLHNGGVLNQHLPDTLETSADHRENKRHKIDFICRDSRLGAGGGPGDESVVSWHRQALESAGRLRVVAKSHDGVIEVVDDPTRPFYVGVQWHPERGGAERLSLGVLELLVLAAGTK